MVLLSNGAVPDGWVSGMLMGVTLRQWWSPQTSLNEEARQRRYRSLTAVAIVVAAIVLAAPPPRNSDQPGSSNAPALLTPKTFTTPPRREDSVTPWIVSLVYLVGFMTMGFATLGLFRLLVTSFHQFLLNLIDMDLRRREELQERRIQNGRLREIQRRSQRWLQSSHDDDDDDDLSLEAYATTMSPLFSYDEVTEDDSSWFNFRGFQSDTRRHSHHHRRRQDRRQVHVDSCRARLERHRRRLIYRLLDGYWTTLVKQDFEQCCNEDGEEEWHLLLPPAGKRLCSTAWREKRSLPLSACHCAVCLSGSYEVGDSVVWSSNPDCCHVYHLECVVQWFLRKMEHAPEDATFGETLSCPYCRLCFFSSQQATAQPAKGWSQPPMLLDREQTRWWHRIRGGGGGSNGNSNWFSSARN